MSDTDRIRVPTNGHRKPLDGEIVPAPSDASAGPTDPALAPAVPPTPDIRIALTPGQLAAGFGIVAGIVLIVLGSRRRGGR